MLRKYSVPLSSPCTIQPETIQNRKLTQTNNKDENNNPPDTDYSDSEKTFTAEEEDKEEGDEETETSLSYSDLQPPQIQTPKSNSVLDAIEASSTSSSTNQKYDGSTSSIINSYFARNAEFLQKRSEEEDKIRPRKSKVEESKEILGSFFEQLRALPPPSDKAGKASSTSSSDGSNTESSSSEDPDPLSIVDDPFTVKLGRASSATSMAVLQCNKNFQLLTSWTDDGRYSRVQAMTIAATFYNAKVKDSEIRAELSPKEKFAYRKFCLEIEDKLQMIIKCTYMTCKESLSERTLRKIWHLYALYTKAYSEEIWDEDAQNASSMDITSRAIAHLVKKTVGGPSTTTKKAPQKALHKTASTLEPENPVLAKYLQDPTHDFLIVYGRYCFLGKVKAVERLRKLTDFNEIAQRFFEKLAEPPDSLDVDMYLHHLRKGQLHRSTYPRSLSLPVGKSKRSKRKRKKRKCGLAVMNKSELMERIDGATAHYHNCSNQFKPGDWGMGANDSYLGDMKTIHRKIQMLDGKKRICLYGCRYEVLQVVALEAGFELVGETELWNINWSDAPLPQDKICQMRRIQDTYSVFWGVSAPLQKTNHFPGMYEICRKDRLGRNLNRLRRLFPNDYHFFPATWDLPTEQGDLIAYAKKRKNLTFIIKPESGCQGKGIFLLRNLKKLSPFTKCVCQVYVPSPFLIDGYKFDQRIYVLITSVDPLRLYIYDEGIARFATVKYEQPTDENLEVVFMHLTNYSLNKFSESYVREGEGSKRKLTAIYKWMLENGHDVLKLKNAIDDIVVKTLLCAAPTLRHNYKTCFPKKDRGCSCFELLGFDILIDSHLNPVLLEVNHSPSFNLDLPVDEEVKKALLRDMFGMVYLGDELSAVTKQKRGRQHESDSTFRKGGRRKSLAKSPPPPPIPDEPFSSAYPDGLPLSLEKQFQHEIKHRGKFRLIFSSERPGRFSRMVDETYSGYHMACTSTCPGYLLEQILDYQQQPQGRKSSLNRNVFFECDQDKNSPSLKMGKQGVLPSSDSRHNRRSNGLLVPPQPKSEARCTSRRQKMREFAYLQRSGSNPNNSVKMYCPNFKYNYHYNDDQINLSDYSNDSTDEEKKKPETSSKSGGGGGGVGTSYKFQFNKDSNNNYNKSSNKR